MYCSYQRSFLCQKTVSPYIRLTNDVPLRVDDHGNVDHRQKDWRHGESSMKHYGIAQWVDFARGLAPVAEGPAMESHLSDSGSGSRALASFSRYLSGAAK